MQTLQSTLGHRQSGVGALQLSDYLGGQICETHSSLRVLRLLKKVLGLVDAEYALLNKPTLREDGELMYTIHQFFRKRTIQSTHSCFLKI